MTTKAEERQADMLVGMKAICKYLGISETTALKWQRELNLPIRKGSKNGDAGVWVGSRKKIDEWSAEFVSGEDK